MYKRSTINWNDKPFGFSGATVEIRPGMFRRVDVSVTSNPHLSKQINIQSILSYLTVPVILADHVQFEEAKDYAEKLVLTGDPSSVPDSALKNPWEDWRLSRLRAIFEETGGPKTSSRRVAMNKMSASRAILSESGIDWEDKATNSRGVSWERGKAPDGTTVRAEGDHGGGGGYEVGFGFEDGTRLEHPTPFRSRQKNRQFADQLWDDAFNDHSDPDEPGTDWEDKGADWDYYDYQMDWNRDQHERLNLPKSRF